MRKFNFYRPLLIIAVAFFAKTLTQTIAMMAGAEKEMAENLGFIAMIIAALITFTRLNKARTRR